MRLFYISDISANIYIFHSHSEALPQLLIAHCRIFAFQSGLHGSNWPLVDCAIIVNLSSGV